MPTGDAARAVHKQIRIFDRQTTGSFTRLIEVGMKSTVSFSEIGENPSPNVFREARLGIAASPAGGSPSTETVVSPARRSAGSAC